MKYKDVKPVDLNAGQIDDLCHTANFWNERICDEPKSIKENSTEETCWFLASKIMDLIGYLRHVENQLEEKESQIEWVSDSMTTDWDDLIVGMPEGYGN